LQRNINNATIDQQDAEWFGSCVLELA
jgi:hypothetical protein